MMSEHEKRLIAQHFAALDFADELCLVVRVTQGRRGSFVKSINGPRIRKLMVISALDALINWLKKYGRALESVTLLRISRCRTEIWEHH
jgi:hypothetical protein